MMLASLLPRLGWALPALLLSALTVQGSAAPRTLRFPLKTQRCIYTDAEIAQARANVSKYPAAKKLADEVIRTADYWLPWSDQDLVHLITPASVPRAFDVGTGGCPKCGQTAHEKFGTYPWIIDPKVPFKVKCPVDGTVYPTNDYEAYYTSGFKEKKGWDTQYVDDGWGWVAPDGQRYWFVAHWNHELWHKFLGPGVLALGRAYLLTGDMRYAHKAAVMLRRIAEVYPDMDHEKQSRYGLMMAAQGVRYRGKVMNAIWETELVREMAEAYDDVWDTIDADRELQSETAMDGAGVRGFIEANLLEDAFDAYDEAKVAGNFGMHQSALVTLSLSRQNGDSEKRFDGLMNETGGMLSHTGLNYALYDFVFRDGLPDETAPGYNALWVGTLTNVANLMKKAGRDVYAIPRMRRLYTGMLDIINVDRFTPSLGDSGVFSGDVAHPSPEAMQSAWAQYHNPLFARWLNGEGDAFPTFESLFRAPVPKVAVKRAPERSRLLDGYGMGILNDPSNTTSLALYYGYKGGHGHFDRLGFELFALGQPMMPDLGYPDAMNDFVKGIYTWSKNTISHNTVTVDASRQTNNVPGTVHLFADGGFARAFDVNGNGTYPQTSEYRRKLMMVDAGPSQSYVVDVFTVKGGKEHDYSLHGPAGPCETLGGDWSDPAPGTLAGPNVAVGETYDDKVLGAPGYKGGYGDYQGSGFQYLTDVRRHTGGEWVAQYANAKDLDAHLRIRVLDQPGQQVLLAHARVSPINHPEQLTYVIARREGKDLDSRFVSVMEPYRGAPFIQSVQRLELGNGTGTALAVHRTGGETDVVLWADSPAELSANGRRLRTDASAAVVTLDADGLPRRVFFAGGTHLTVGERTFTAPRPPAGRVESVDAAAETVRVRLDAPIEDPKALSGRVVHFRNGLHLTAHPVTSARVDGEDLVLTVKDDLLVGRARVTEIGPDGLTTNTALPLAPIYRGATVSDEGFHTFATVREVSDGHIRTEGPLPAPNVFQAGRDAWLLDVGPGDRLEAPAIFSQTAMPVP